MSLIRCCPACQSTEIELMLDMGKQPVSLLNLQEDPAASSRLTRHSTRLYICRNCSHVHNFDFDPSHVAYSREGCRMYNEGIGWQKHVAKARTIVEQIPDVDTIIEVGAGDCEFLSSIKTDAHKLAVDPCEAVASAEQFGIDYIRDYFDPPTHMTHGDSGTVVVMRHLLEHMENPRELIEPIVHEANSMPNPTSLFIEVPCCQNALTRNRIEDWTYEHAQHFTLNSLLALFHACGIKAASCQTSYNGEVVLALARIDPDTAQPYTIRSIVDKYNRAGTGIEKASRWVEDNIDNIAFWGGSGKSALLLNALRVPDSALVVDSHNKKWGFCVPGTGIKMRCPHELKHTPVDTIIATTSWRAEDIRDEILMYEIPCKKLLKFENGDFVEVPLV